MWTESEIRQELDRLNRIQPFWHSIRLPYGLYTIDRNGEERLNHNEVKWRRIKEFIDPTGKKVIDVGCNEGFFSIEMVKAGAEEVFSIDINAHRIEKAHFVMDLLDMRKIRLQQMNIFDFEVERDGEFEYRPGPWSFASCPGSLYPS